MVERRAAGNVPRQPSKGEVALPPFDRRFQLDYPAVDDPGIRFRQSGPSEKAPAPPAEMSQATTSVILVPVDPETLRIAMARSGPTDAADLVEHALRQFAQRSDPSV